MQHSHPLDDLEILKSKVISRPDDVEAICELADAYADQNRWSEAIGQYQIAIRLDAVNSDLHNDLGIAYEEVGRLEDAESAYRQAIALNPKNSMPHYNLGTLYEKQQRISKAVQAYRDCLQHSTDSNERSEVRKKIVGLTSETSTGQSRLAYRLAAGVMFLTIGISVMSGLIAGLSFIILFSGGVDFVLAVGLFQFRPGARGFTLFRATLGAIAVSLLAFTGNDPSAALVTSINVGGYCGAVILLLTGQSKTWRLILALGIFVVFYLGILAVTLLKAFYK